MSLMLQFCNNTKGRLKIEHPFSVANTTMAVYVTCKPSSSGNGGWEAGACE